MDWRDTRFRATTFFFERIFAPLYLLLWALITLVLVVGLIAVAVY